MQVEVHLDRPGAVYRPGETLTGRVIVVADAVRDCERIVLRTVCRTTGSRLLEESGVAQEITLPGGRFAAGERRELPFQLQGPRTPSSWTGTIVTWTWQLEAHAVLVGGRDAATAQVIRVEPEPRPFVITPLKHGSPRRVNANPGYVRMLMWIALVLAACGGVIVHGLSHDADYWVAGLVIGIVALIPGVGAVIGLVTARHIGNVQTRVRPSSGLLEVTLWLKPSPLVRGVHATLAVLEIAENWHPGHAPETREHAIYEHAIELAPVAERAGEYTGTLRLPAPGQVPCSLDWPYAHIAWRVVARVALDGLPDEEDVVRLRASMA